MKGNLRNGKLKVRCLNTHKKIIFSRKGLS